MAEQPGVGIIGTGWGARVQVPAFRAAGLEVRALAGSNAEKTGRIATELGVGFASGDWRALLARDDLALISIVTPPGLHREMAAAVLAAGKHVLCEKPTALDANEARAMAEAARGRSDCFALIDHQLRFLPAFRKARELIGAGAIGAVRQAQAMIANGSRLDGRPWNWWSDAAQGGGALGALGSHVVDGLRYLVGEITAVSGHLHTYISEREYAGGVRAVSADDFAAFQLQLAGDVYAHATVSVVAQPGVTNEFLVLGSSGTLRLRGSRLLQGDADGNIQDITPPSDVVIPAGVSGTFPEATVYQGHALRAALESGSCEPILAGASFDDGLRVQQALDAIRRSAREEGRWIALV